MFALTKLAVNFAIFALIVIAAYIGACKILIPAIAGSQVRLLVKSAPGKPHHFRAEVV